jgi:hypothetical protein
MYGRVFFLGFLGAKKHPKQILCYKRYKIQEYFWMRKPNANHGL